MNEREVSPQMRTYFPILTSHLTIYIKSAVRGNVEVCAAVAVAVVGFNVLDGLQQAVGVGEDYKVVGEFAEEVGEAAIGIE